ncbi:hypothetical protein DPX16_12205 [Anabarilius grahami]|uniref:Uncharacterized protein n=1 Tax=Anabarilius grahami TaxID=495550 RepID=A0A3N0YQU5_ANAGA|nr:hypothetical protein DPX16_12205 [Anabarilius grahami]
MQVSCSHLQLLALWPNGSIGHIPQSKRRTIFTQPPHPAPLPPRVSVVESSSALQLGHLPEAGHPQWDVRCLTQAPAALGLKPQLRPAAGFLVKADRLQASDSSHRILCCRQRESITAETWMPIQLPVQTTGYPLEVYSIFPKPYVVALRSKHKGHHSV